MSESPYRIEQLDPTCLAIDENGVRCFLFLGTEKALLVDTGFGTGDLKRVVDSLTNLPLTLVNTHADRDHVGCNQQFPVVRMHPAEYDRYAQKADADLKALAPVWEGETIDIGGRRFEVVFIPGHTPGSIALLDAENRILVGGDSIQNGNIFMFGPGRSVPAYRDSMRRLAGMADRFDTVYASHGDAKVPASMIAGLVEDAVALMGAGLPGETHEVHGMRVHRVKGCGTFLIAPPD